MLCCVVWATQFDEEPFAEAFGKNLERNPQGEPFFGSFMGCVKVAEKKLSAYGGLVLYIKIQPRPDLEWRASVKAIGDLQGLLVTGKGR